MFLQRASAREENDFEKNKAMFHRMENIVCSHVKWGKIKSALKDGFTRFFKIHMVGACEYVYL